ncbi:MAG: DUF397 domain-containing protein [Streptosporangiaceae bacterium]
MSDDRFSGWRKSSYSGDGNSCVELGSARPGGSHSSRAAIGVRDSQANDCSPVLEFSASAWQEFLNRLKLG